MKRLIFAWSISLVVAVSASVASAAGIQGTVRGPDGKPAQGLDVRLEPKTGKAQATKTDKGGHYSFANLTSGSYKVTVMSAGLIKAFMDGVAPASPKRLDFDLKLAAAGKPAKKARHLVWVPAETGTNIGGRWVEEDDANIPSADRVGKMSGEGLRRIQDRSANPPGN